MDYFTHNTFVSHYKTAKFLFKNAQSSNDGQFYNLVSCISFCAFSLESYINHQGFIEQGKKWIDWDEDMHPAFTEKIKKLAKIIHLDINFNDNLFSIITPLFQFRKVIVHGNTEQVIKNIRKPQNNTKASMLQLSSQIDKFSTLKNAEDILKKTKIIIEMFNENSKYKISNNRLFSLGNGSYPVKRI